MVPWACCATGCRACCSSSGGLDKAGPEGYTHPEAEMAKLRQSMLVFKQQQSLEAAKLDFELRLAHEKIAALERARDLRASAGIASSESGAAATTPAPGAGNSKEQSKPPPAPHPITPSNSSSSSNFNYSANSPSSSYGELPPATPAKKDDDVRVNVLKSRQDSLRLNPPLI